MKLTHPSPESLESRIAPATFHWNVNASGDWTSPANWFNETTNTAADGIPSSGDTAIFGGVITGDCTVTIPDGTTASVGHLVFDDDNHYTIAALGAGTLNGVTSITVAATSGQSDHTISAPIVLGGSLAVTNDSAAALLDLSGAISGFGVLAKKGVGTARLSGASGNTYNFGTQVEAGVLELGKTSGLAVPGSLIIGYTFPGDLATVRLLASNQISDGVGLLIPLAISDNGTLDLNGFDETVGTIQMTSGEHRGAVITTGAGTLSISDINVVASGTVNGPFGSFGSSIAGKLNLGAAQRVIVITDGAAEVDLLITADISGTGAASLVEDGSGRLELKGAVQLPGGISVVRGTLGAEASVGNVSAASEHPKVIRGEGPFGDLSTNLASVQVGEGIGIMNVTGAAQFSLGSLQIELDGLDAGQSYDQLVVGGTVTLSGASLAVLPGFAAAAGDQFVIVNNTGSSAVSGTFANLPEGAIFGADRQYFRISYEGGDGNDVVLTALVPELHISSSGKVATFLDVDGDLVTVKTSAGHFAPDDFVLIPAGKSFGGQQLALLSLPDANGEFARANITITAKRSAFGGDGFVNLGFLDASGTQLGKVKIAGDLGRISVGNGAGVALKSLVVGSIGELGTATQESGGHLVSQINGSLGSLMVNGSIRDAIVLADSIKTGIIRGSLIGGARDWSGLILVHELGSLTVAGDIRGGDGVRSGAILVDGGNLGRLVIGGSLDGGSGANSGSIGASQGFVGSVTIGGSITASKPTLPLPTYLPDVGSVYAGTYIGSLKVRGDVLGRPDNPVVVSAMGQAASPLRGPDLAIKSLSVGGDVESLQVLAGYTPEGTAANADASIGSITVRNQWRVSTVLAGVGPGDDGVRGTADDVKLGPGVRDQAELFSQIASVTIRGHVYADDTGTKFGIIAEQVGKARIGTTVLPFKAGARSPGDFFVLAESALGPIGFLGEVAAADSIL